MSRGIVRRCQTLCLPTWRSPRWCAGLAWLLFSPHSDLLTLRVLSIAVGKEPVYLFKPSSGRFSSVFFFARSLDQPVVMTPISLSVFSLLAWDRQGLSRFSSAQNRHSKDSFPSLHVSVCACNMAVLAVASCSVCRGILLRVQAGAGCLQK